MPSGLLEFLDIDQPEPNWIFEIGSYLDRKLIKYDLESDHIKFKMFILDLDIYLKDKIFNILIRRNHYKPKTDGYLVNLLDFALFGLIKIDDSIIVKHRTIKKVLEFINIISEIVKSLKNTTCAGPTGITG